MYSSPQYFKNLSNSPVSTWETAPVKSNWNLLSSLSRWKTPVNLLKEEKKSIDWASVLSPPPAVGIEQGGGRERQSGICVDIVTHCWSCGWQTGHVDARFTHTPQTGAELRNPRAAGRGSRWLLQRTIVVLTLLPTAHWVTKCSIDSNSLFNNTSEKCWTRIKWQLKK